MTTRYLARNAELYVRDGAFVQPEPGCPTVDLGGWVMPGFVDCHCHILPTGLDLLRPTLGQAGSVEEMLEIVALAHAKLEPGRWLQAVHYDQNKLPGALHLHRDQLDAITAERPILLRHTSGHASVGNTAALMAAGVGESSPDPRGGTFVRDAAGRLTGVLLEKAHELVTAAAPEPSLEEMVEAILRAGQAMARYGIVAATDMMTGRWSLPKELDAYRISGERGCAIALRTCLQWGTVFGPKAMDAAELRDRLAAFDGWRSRAWGIKLFADGAVGSATAAIYGAYQTTGKNGTLIYPPDELQRRVQVAHDAGWKVAIHAIGDRAVDHVMDAFESTGEPSRHRLEHAMLLSDAQVERIRASGVPVTMQPEFLMRFGHAYQAQLPPERAAKIKRCRSLVDAGVFLAFSSDRPIVQGNPWDGIRSAVDRPAGFDPREALTWTEAIDAYTAKSALAQGDAELGTLDVGARACFQVYLSAPSPHATPAQVYFAGGPVMATGQ